jgi:hypothetical protein
MEQERTIAVACSGPLSLLWTIRQEPGRKTFRRKKGNAAILRNGGAVL